MRKIPLLFAIVPLLAAHATEPVATHESTVVANKPNHEFADFGAYAILPAELAKDPARARELAFVTAAKSRLQRKVDRTDSTEKLIARFRKEFDPKQVHYATAITFASLVGHQGSRLKKEDGDLAREVLQDVDDIPPDAAVLYLKARTDLSKQRSVGPGVENLFRLKDWIIKNPDYTGFPEKIRNTPQEEVLYSIFTDNPQYTHLAEKEFAENIKFIDLLKKIPEEQKTAAMHVAIGRHILHLAWRARGSAFAGKTDPKQLEAFEKLLYPAGEHFRAALKLDPSNFDAYENLLTVAMASEDAADGSVDHWFTEGCAHVASPEYLLRHYAHASQLRWGGRPEAIISAYQTALKNNDYDGAIPWQAADIMEKLILDMDGDRKDMLRRAVAKDYIKISNAYTRRLNETGKPLIGSDGAPFNIRAKAIAKLVDAEMIAAITELGASRFPEYDKADINNVNPSISDGNRAGYSRQVAEYETGDGRLFRKWDYVARIRAHPADSDDESIRRQPTIPEVKQAIAALETSLKKTKSEIGRDYVESLIGILTCKLEFLEGKTAKIPMRRSQWEDPYLSMNFDGKSISADRYTWTNISHIATYLDNFEPPYEVTLNIASDWYTKWPHPGLLLGRNLTAVHKRAGGIGRSFVIEPDTGTMRVIPPHSGLDKTKLTMKNKSYEGKASQIRVRLFDRGYSVSVNGGPFESKHDPEFQPLGISVGCLLGYMANGKFTFHDMSIRKIPAAEITEKEAGFGLTPQPADSAKVATTR